MYAGGTATSKKKEKECQIGDIYRYRDFNAIPMFVKLVPVKRIGIADFNLSTITSIRTLQKSLQAIDTLPHK